MFRAILLIVLKYQLKPTRFLTILLELELKLIKHLRLITLNVKHIVGNLKKKIIAYSFLNRLLFYRNKNYFLPISFLGSSIFSSGTITASTVSVLGCLPFK